MKVFIFCSHKFCATHVLKTKRKKKNFGIEITSNFIFTIFSPLHLIKQISVIKIIFFHYKPK